MRQIITGLAGALLLATPALAVNGVSSKDVDGWHLTTFEGLRCSATQLDKRPSLEIDVSKSDGATSLSLTGLPFPNPEDDPQGLLGMYQAAVTVSLDGNKLVDVSLTKTTGFLTIDKIGFDKLDALSPPGTITFDLTGQSGQHETFSYVSSGLKTPIDFLKHCAG